MRPTSDRGSAAGYIPVMTKEQASGGNDLDELGETVKVTTAASTNGTHQILPRRRLR